MSLDPSRLAALNLLKERFTRGRPRALLASRGELPFLMFTDGALEEGHAKLGVPPATIGGLLWPGRSQRPEYFACAVPESVLEMSRADGKSHVIGLVELYAVVVGIRTWKSYFGGKEVDNVRRQLHCARCCYQGVRVCQTVARFVVAARVPR